MFINAYTVTATNLRSSSKGYKVLQYILNKEGATKYECVTEVLGKTGSRSELRGYYSDSFRGWVDNGVLTRDPKTMMYNITPYGRSLVLKASLR